MAALTPRARFRPCLDLHEGRVKQIVGGTLTDDGSSLRENFVSELPPSHFIERYRQDDITGGHVIMLGPGNEDAAREALATWPGGLQIGGGITESTALKWMEAGASHVIVTSRIFSAEGQFLPDRLAALVSTVGRDRLVLDLSCRRTATGWVVAMNRWQTLTNLPITTAVLDDLAASCAEFLIHAADVEGRMAGMDEALIQLLGHWGRRPVTYAGGAATRDDLRRCHQLGNGRVDLTIGSALDLFGGTGVRYADCVAWNRGEWD
ncbi:MAG: phosphoribosylformimino-5-aminoimidazole carboxamide ribotide isomerase [Verrucomicrobiales bacterium]